MAGDWIKMRVDLQTHPKVVRILSATRADKFRVIGGLHAVWSVFDTHSTDGNLIGYTPETLDHILGWEGFSAALIAVGWLESDEETLTLPEFTEHNGQSAKRRADDQKRKKDARKRPDYVRTDCGQDADKKRTREEKRREEEKHTSSSSSDDQQPEREALRLDGAHPADLASRQSERLAQVTKDAIETFNASALVKKNGGALASVSEAVGREKRQAQVRRCVRTARQICAERYGGSVISRDFLADYWAECSRDDFMAGRKAGGKGHENWLPDFEYLTREDVMLKVYDRAASEDVA